MHEHPTRPIYSERYGSTEDGQEVRRFVLTNGGLQISVIEYGAIVEDLVSLSSHGRYSLCRRLESLEDYEANTACVGAMVGPFVDYEALVSKQASTADDGHSQRLDDLAGGVEGLHRLVWQGREVVDFRGPCVELETVHEHGMDGYAGNLYVRVRFILAADATCHIEYEALSDDDRPINFTHHCYWSPPIALGRANHNFELGLNTSPPHKYTSQAVSEQFGLVSTGDARCNQVFFESCEDQMSALGYVEHGPFRLSVHSDQDAMYLNSHLGSGGDFPFVCLAPIATARDVDGPCAFVLEPSRLFRQKCMIRVVIT
jgi:galactose mutarotase-like enzyme